MKAVTLLLCTFALAASAPAETPAMPDTPAAVDGLVYAREFTLEKGYQFAWRKENTLLEKGTLLVLKVDPAFGVRRQMPEPVLYVGDQTAERVNDGDESGHIIAIVPGEVDLTKAPIWFGKPDLPERVDAEKIQEQRALANEAGIKPFSKEQVEAAREKGGAPLKVADQDALLRGEVADLILKYSPQEKHLADTFRVPVLKRPSEPPAEED
jgi:hypothetical protein